MGGAKNKPLRLEFDHRLKLEFHGAKVTVEDLYDRFLKTDLR